MQMQNEYERIRKKHEVASIIARILRAWGIGEPEWVAVEIQQELINQGIGFTVSRDGKIRERWKYEDKLQDMEPFNRRIV
jgi:hypothetical protein